VVVPHPLLRAYHCVERAAAAFRASHGVVLRDVVYVCSDAMYDAYCDYVAQAVRFPDAEVWVASPTRERRVQTWRAAPTDGIAHHALAAASA
jgi:hypothetical protein